MQTYFHDDAAAVHVETKKASALRLDSSGQHQFWCRYGQHGNCPLRPCRCERRSRHEGNAYEKISPRRLGDRDEMHNLRLTAIKDFSGNAVNQGPIRIGGRGDDSARIVQPGVLRFPRNKEGISHGTQGGLLGEHRSGGGDVALCGIRLPVWKSAGGSRIRSRGISATTEGYSGDRQTSWRDRAARAGRGHAQRVGLCRIHIRMDLCVFCALSCWRWSNSLLAVGVIGAPSRLLLYPPSEPPVPGHRHTDLVKTRKLTGASILPGWRASRN